MRERNDDESDVRNTRRRGAVSTGTITPRTSEYSTRATRRLLDCGIVAGPVFATTVAIQVLTRDGYDLTQHPISMLSLGELGWIQIVNFVLAGLLSIAFAVGMRRVLHSGRAGTWGPVLDRKSTRLNSSH